MIIIIDFDKELSYTSAGRITETPLHLPVQGGFVVQIIIVRKLAQELRYVYHDNLIKRSKI